MIGARHIRGLTPIFDVESSHGALVVGNAPPCHSWLSPLAPNDISIVGAMEGRWRTTSVILSGSNIDQFTDLSLNSIDMPAVDAATLSGDLAVFPAPTLAKHYRHIGVVSSLEDCTFTAFFVVTPDTSDAQFVLTAAWNNGGSYSIAQSYPYIGIGFSGVDGEIFVGARNNASTSSLYTAASQALYGTGPHVVAIQVQNGVTDGTQIWVDDVQVAETTFTKPGGTTTIDCTCLSGRPHYFGSGGGAFHDTEFVGDFYECIVYDDSLSQEEMRRVSAWLHTEWATVQPC